MAQLQAGLFAGLPGEPALLGSTSVNGRLDVSRTVTVSGGTINIGNRLSSLSLIKMYAGNFPFVPPQLIPNMNIFYGGATPADPPSFELQRFNVLNSQFPNSAMISISPSQTPDYENEVVMRGTVEGHSFTATTTVQGFNGLRFDGPYRLDTIEDDLVLEFADACIYLIGSPIVEGYCKIELPFVIADGANGQPLLKLVSNSALRQRVEIYDGDVPRVHVGTVDVTGQQVVDVIFDDETDTGLFAVFSPYSETGDITPEIDPGPPPEDPPAVAARRPARRNLKKIPTS